MTRWYVFNIALNATMALFNLWLSSWSNLWLLSALFWVIHVSLVGYWIWAIFDNIEQARIYAEIDEALYASGALYHDDPVWPKASQIEDEIRRNLNGEEAQ